MASKLDTSDAGFTCSNCQLDLLMHQIREVSKTLLNLNNLVKTKTKFFNLLNLYGILSRINYNCKRVKDSQFFLHDEIEGTQCNPLREENEISPFSEEIVQSNIGRNGYIKDVFNYQTDEKTRDEKLITNFQDFKNLSVFTEEEHAIALLVQKEFDSKRLKEEEEMMDLENISEENERHMECPICFDVPEKAPVYKCVNSHIICNKCKPSMLSDKCPICNVVLGDDRCFVTELYIANRPKKCRYERYGCKVVDRDITKLSEHERSCSKAPSEIELEKEREKNNQLLRKRKDVELALEVDEAIQDDLKAQEVQDEGLAIAIQQTQEQEMKKISIEEEDYKISLQMEQEILKEQEELEEQKRQQEASDFEYAQKLQSEMEGNNIDDDYDD